jgi:hypothetical protein
MHPRWISHHLTDRVRQVRVAKCHHLLRVLEAMQRTRFRHIVTSDESWLDLEYQHASQWSVSRYKVPQRVNSAIGTAQFMLPVVWGVSGFHLLELMRS